MAEDYTLTDPITEPEKVTTKYKVITINMTIAPSPSSQISTIFIELRDNLGNPLQHQYVDEEALDMLKWLNTANFSVNSMQKRILQKLQNDGVLPPGTITGTPDPPPVE